MFDAVRMRTIEIGEAARDLPDGLLAHEPSIPWKDVMGVRDVLAHRYFDTEQAVIEHMVRHDLPQLVAACRCLLERVDSA